MATLAELIVRIGADATQFEKHMGKVERALNKTSRTLTDVGGKLTTGLTLPLVAAGGGALKASIDFESAFAGVRKTVDATDEELAEMRQGILDMSKELPASVTEISAIAEAAGQLGIETENILGFTRVMADLGVTTNMSSEEAATSLARLANITQMPQTEFDRLGSTVVALGNNLATTEAEIVQMGLRIAGAGSQVGMTEAEILSFAGALSSVGIEAEAGGSAISKVMINIASEVAAGGEKLELFAQVAGMSSEEFAQAWQEDAAGALVTFIEGLGRMSAEGENVFGVLDELGLSEIRVRDALLRASGAGDLFRRSLELGSQAWDENTALTNEAAQRYGTTESQLRILRNQLVDVGITLGDALAPALRAAITAAQPLIAAVGRMAEWFANLDPRMQRIIITVAAVAAGIGPLLLGLGKLISIGSGVIGIIKLLPAVLGALVSPVGLVVAVVAALGLAFATNFMGIRDTATQVFGQIAAHVQAVWPTVQATITTVIQTVQAIITTVLAAIQAVWQQHGDQILSFATTVWGAIRDLIDLAIRNISDIVTTVMQMVQTFWAENGQQIMDAAQIVWQRIQEVVSTVASILWTVISTVMTAIQAIWRDHGEQILRIAQNVWDNIKAVIETVINVILGIIKLITSLIRGDWEGAWNAIKGIAESIWNGIYRIISNLLDSIKTAISIALDFVRPLWEQVWNGIKETTQNIWDGIVRTVKGAINAIIEGINTLIRAWNRLELRIPGFGVDIPQIDIPGIGPVGGGHLGWPGLTIGTLDIPTIPLLAAGGLVTRPTLAMLGERGPEAVLPLRDSAALDTLAERIVGAIMRRPMFTINANYRYQDERSLRDDLRLLQMLGAAT